MRANRYLNNVIEHDHRAIKRRCSEVLGFKSLNSAAITLAGFELAHRIRKHQYDVPRMQDEDHASLKSLWRSVLNQTNDQKSRAPPALPSMHQISADTFYYRRQRPKRRFSRRHPLRVPYGQGLYLLVTPSGGRFWKYRYQFCGKKGILALGEYPIVPLARAKFRHAAARQFVKEGVDPATKRRELRYLTA